MHNLNCVIKVSVCVYNKTVHSHPLHWLSTALSSKQDLSHHSVPSLQQWGLCTAWQSVALNYQSQSVVLCYAPQRAQIYYIYIYIYIYIYHTP